MNVVTVEILCALRYVPKLNRTIKVLFGEINAVTQINTRLSDNLLAVAKFAGTNG